MGSHDSDKWHLALRAAKQPSVSAVRQAARKDTQLPSYVRRIIAGYELRACWFELFEMGRKLCLVGVSVIIQPGGLAQRVYLLLISFATFSQRQREFDLLTVTLNHQQNRLPAQRPNTVNHFLPFGERLGVKADQSIPNLHASCLRRAFGI